MKNPIFAILTGFAILVSCSESDDANKNVPAQSKRVKIYMHDQPAEYQQVNVDVQSIEIKGGGNNETINIGNYAGVYNLLDLQDGTMAILADTLVGFGYISQVRLILGSNNTVMVNDVLHPLATPSAQQSGLKINVHEDLSQVDSLVITLDFDAHESVIKTGNGGYILKPVIKLSS